MYMREFRLVLFPGPHPAGGIYVTIVSECTPQFFIIILNKVNNYSKCVVRMLPR